MDLLRQEFFKRGTKVRYTGPDDSVRGLEGVVTEVLPNGFARVDFGDHGVHKVTIDHLDNANKRGAGAGSGERPTS